MIIFMTDFITDSYVYFFSLNILILLIPILILWKLDALNLIDYTVAITFFSVWFGYYFINYTIIKDEKAFMTDDIEVFNYIPTGSRSGIKCRYNGGLVSFPATKEADRLYELYGDSVINHIHVRLSIKKALPHVYYIDDAFIEYDED